MLELHPDFGAVIGFVDSAGMVAGSATTTILSFVCDCVGPERSVEVL